MAYPASQHGVLGFKFDLSYTVTPPPKVRMTYKVRNTTTGQLNDYCVDLNPGTNAVYFSNVTQNCFQAGGAVLTAGQADHIESIQWQVPTHLGIDTLFGYCIDKITPLTQ